MLPSCRAGALIIIGSEGMRNKAIDDADAVEINIAAEREGGTCSEGI